MPAPTESPTYTARRLELVEYIAAHGGLTTAELADVWSLDRKVMGGRLDTASNLGLVRHEPSIGAKGRVWYVAIEEEKAG